MCGSPYEDRLLHASARINYKIRSIFEPLNPPLRLVFLGFGK